ncbi:hypothetical protein CDL12_01402 [Handroanthus impetiginosus]|uniref:FAF domain-containing protein n=1 Tax=Handroanthus impetiginosus TaxID=429701 RepID=A0A2G9I884_9LAMI|nr:hypothetical protein CDL12_01402 [Handroanthus impetiginosus]
MIISNPKIKHIIPIKKPILPRSSPVFADTKIFQENEIMSSTSTVCQGLQSCLEPLLLEPRVLVHQLAPSKQALSFPWPQKQHEIPLPDTSKTEKNSETNTDCQAKPTGNWSLIQSLTNNSYNIRQSTHEPEQIYVHPLVKRSSSSLSTKSLEMCTESLGSETGNASGSCFYEISYNTLQKQSSTKVKQTKPREISKKIKPSSSFPPPLTSISGSEGIHVKTHREGGRLVIKAVSFSTCTSYFQVERENGRLKLSLFKDGHTDIDSENDEEEEHDDEIEDHLKEEKKEYEDEDDFNGFWGENVKEDGGKIGCKKWCSSRCNGDGSGSKRLPSFHYCVAIS